MIWPSELIIASPVSSHDDSMPNIFMILL